MKLSADRIRRHAEKLLNWVEGGSNCFSLPQLQSFVRGRDKEFDDRLYTFIKEGRHMYVQDDHVEVK